MIVQKYDAIEVRHFHVTCRFL